MAYVVVSKGTGLIITDGPNKARAYKTHGAAKATVTRLVTKQGWNHADLMIVDHSTYRAPMKTVRNLITGTEIQIAADTPRCCDPSSELFWSM
jgi:hypothetical protein